MFSRTLSLLIFCSLLSLPGAYAGKKSHVARLDCDYSNPYQCFRQLRGLCSPYSNYGSNVTYGPYGVYGGCSVGNYSYSPYWSYGHRTYASTYNPYSPYSPYYPYVGSPYTSSYGYGVTYRSPRRTLYRDQDDDRSPKVYNGKTKNVNSNIGSYNDQGSSGHESKSGSAK